MELKCFYLCFVTKIKSSVIYLPGDINLNVIFFVMSQTQNILLTCSQLRLMKNKFQDTVNMKMCVWGRA